jgi:hypothetical protein
MNFEGLEKHQKYVLAKAYQVKVRTRTNLTFGAEELHCIRIRMHICFSLHYIFLVMICPDMHKDIRSRVRVMVIKHP